LQRCEQLVALEGAEQRGSLHVPARATRRRLSGLKRAKVERRE
jgi:hypothetical protein